jgi:hypothetical protein
LVLLLSLSILLAGPNPARAIDLVGQQVDLTYNFGNDSGSLSTTVGAGAEFVIEGVPGTPGFSVGTIDIAADTLTLTHNRGTTLGPGFPTLSDDSLVLSFPNLPGASITSVALTTDPAPQWFGGLAFDGTSITLTQLLAQASVNAQPKIWTIDLREPFVLEDAALVVGAAPALENTAGTLRIVEPELAGVALGVFVVPEPGFLQLLAPGLMMLGAGSGRRRLTMLRRAAAAS